MIHNIRMNKNPLSGKSYFDDEGNLWMEKDIKFPRQLDPPVTPTEWFYLLFKACEERKIPHENTKELVKSWRRSRATEWRTKKSLIKKGYL